jgi:hypothetical protein
MRGAAEAFAWCQRAVAAGSEMGTHLAVVSLQELGRTAEAEQLERYRWNTQGQIAAPWRADDDLLQGDVRGR